MINSEVVRLLKKIKNEINELEEKPNKEEILLVMDSYIHNYEKSTNNLKPKNYYRLFK